MTSDQFDPLLNTLATALTLVVPRWHIPLHSTGHGQVDSGLRAATYGQWRRGRRSSMIWRRIVVYIVRVRETLSGSRLV